MGKERKTPTGGGAPGMQKRPESPSRTTDSSHSMSRPSGGSPRPETSQRSGFQQRPESSTMQESSSRQAFNQRPESGMRPPEGVQRKETGGRVELGQRQESGFKPGQPEVTGITGNVENAQKSYTEMMNGRRSSSQTRQPEPEQPRSGFNPPQRGNSTQPHSAPGVVPTMKQAMGKTSSRVELSPRSSYEIVSGGKSGTKSMVSKLTEDGTISRRINDITGRMTAASKQQLHTSKGYDASNLTQVTTFYGGKRSMTSENTDNKSFNADRFMTQSVVTNGQGRTTTDKALAQKYGLTYVDPSTVHETFSGFVPKDANSALAKQQREWMVQSLEKEKAQLVKTVPKTEFERTALNQKVANIDKQIKNIRSGTHTNDLQTMDKYTHIKSFTFKVKDDTGEGLNLRRSRLGRVGQKVVAQKYKLMSATNGTVKMSARMALDTLSRQDDMASNGLRTVVEGAELVSFIPIVATNYALKKFHNSVITDHMESFHALNMGKRGGMQVCRVQDVKAQLETLGFKGAIVKKIGNSRDLQEFANQILKNNENGKVTLTKQQLNYLKAIAGGGQVDARQRLNQITKALEEKGFNMGAIKGLNPTDAKKVLNTEYKRINNILKKAGKAPLGPEIKSLLTEHNEISRHLNAAGNRKLGARYKMRAIHQFILKPLQKNGGIAGQGLATTIQVASITKAIVLFELGLINKTARLAARAGLEAVLGATKLRAWNLQRQVSNLKAAGNLKKASELEAKATKLTTRANKLRKMPNPIDHLRNKIGEKISNSAVGKGASKAKETILKPFKFISAQFRRFGNFLTTKTPLKLVKDLMKFLDKIGQVIGSIVKPILAFCSGFLTIVVIIILLLLIINSIISAFNIGGQEYDTQQLIVEYLRDDCFLATFTEIDEKIKEAENNKPVNQKTITFVDYKDYEEYEKHINEADEDEFFTQSSNCAEILSMTLIKFNFDFGTAKDRLILPGTSYDDRYKSVQEYVKGLWNGSHSIMITADRDSSAPDKLNVDIIWTTIYFNGLFDCSLSDSMDIQYYETQPRTYNLGNLYYYLRNMGVPHEGAIAIMTGIASNVSITSPVATDTVVDTLHQFGGHYGIGQWISPVKDTILEQLETDNKKPENLEGQLTYMLNEIKDGNSALYSQLLSTSTSETIEIRTEAFLQDYIGKTPSTPSTPSGTPSSSPSATPSGTPSSGYESDLALAAELDALFAPYKNDAEKLEELKPAENSLIAETAMKYIGHNHYTQGGYGYPGHRLTNANGSTKLATTGTGFKDSVGLVGTDCTGLVMYVMSELGYEHLYWSTSGYPMNVGDKAGSTECVWAGTPANWSEAEAIIESGDIIVATGGGMGHAMICTQGNDSDTVMQCAMNGPKCGQVVGQCANDSSEKSASGYFSWVKNNYSGVKVRLFRLMA